MPVSQGYTRAQILLHWAVAVLIIPQFLLGENIAEAFGKWMSSEPTPFNPAVVFHVMTGLTICALVIWRLVLRLRHGAPAALDSGSPVMNKVASGVQHTMYLVLILMVVSGGTAWFGLIGPAAGVHNVLKLVLLLLILIHVAGAVKGQFVLKNGIIRRMMKAE